MDMRAHRLKKLIGGVLVAVQGKTLQVAVGREQTTAEVKEGFGDIEMKDIYFELFWGSKTCIKFSSFLCGHTSIKFVLYITINYSKGDFAHIPSRFKPLFIFPEQKSDLFVKFMYKMEEVK